MDTWTLGHLDTYLNIAGVLWSGACGQWRACRGPHWSSRCWRVSRTPCDSPCQSWTPGTLRSCSWSPPDSPGTGWLPCSQHWTLGWHGETYIGKSPSTRQMYSFLTCLVLIWVSISRALPGFLPNISSPEVRRSSLETQWSGVTWQASRGGAWQAAIILIELTGVYIHPHHVTRLESILLRYFSLWWVVEGPCQLHHCYLWIVLRFFSP